MTSLQENSKSRPLGYWNIFHVAMAQFTRIRKSKSTLDDVQRSATRMEHISAKTSLLISNDVVTKLSIWAGCSAGPW